MGRIAIRHITNCLRGIQHAWHFYYALVLVIKAVCDCRLGVRASPLNKALAGKWKTHQKKDCLCLKNR
ncbi:TPA: DUF3265 domain-containing protein [Vibrio vulnificus]|nr:DUF3265 domain-containing protein [Vibrio vulnificus]